MARFHATLHLTIGLKMCLNSGLSQHGRITNRTMTLQIPVDRVAGKIVAVVGLFLSLAVSRGADFNVTSPGSFYSINGMSQNPTITVVRGELYTFSIATAASHPFRILNSAGVTNNNISNGTISWRVPTNAVNYRYDCSIHLFGGPINTIPPPTVRIVGLNVGANLVVRSTGTNNWLLQPQYSTNLGMSNWTGLTVQSNRFLNGTNETFCGRPPGTNVFVRVRAQRN